MAKYKVKFQELIFKEVIVEADSPDEAEELVEDGEFEGERETDSGEIAVNEVIEIR